MAFASFVLLFVLGSPGAVHVRPAATGIAERGKRTWSISHAPGTIDRIHVELARGEVEVVRRPGAVRIDAWKRAGRRRDAALSILETRSGRALRVFDAYPSPRGALRECHPPHAERGAFWDSDSAVEVVVSAPEGVAVSAFIMAGGPGR
jgi:hypothetical protein